MIKQQTIATEVTYSGISLHRGVRTALRMLPAPENTGIVFRRIDLPGKPEVLAHASNVVDVRRATTLSNGAATVVTIEHVMASFHALGIDNCIVEMNDIEPPIADGSAIEFVNMIEKATIVEQQAPARFFELETPIFYENNDTQLVVLPAKDFKISCLVAFGVTPLDTQYYSTVITPEIFKCDIAKGRTFCQYKELEYMMANNLALGGSLDNAMILHDGAVISKEGQRYANELVRHKMLDIVGDFYLLGARLLGHIIAIKPGHPSNVAMAQKMLEQVNQNNQKQTPCKAN